MNVSNNVSSINAQQTIMNTSANNVANVNTNSYIPKDTIAVGKGDSVSTNTRISDDTGSTRSQTDLAKETTTQIVSQNATGVNVAAIKTKDQMLGSLLDMKA